jgi:hypothetical protein
MYIETLASGRPRPILNERGEREMDNRKKLSNTRQQHKKTRKSRDESAVKKFS